jgi:hypothetical protein
MMIFPDGSSGANKRDCQEQKAGDLQPQDMQHTAYAAESNATSSIEGSYPTIFAGLAARNTKKCSALSTEIAG